jgi:thiamine biosynthesis protein ThiC
MTQIDAARAGRVTEQMKIVAEKEHLDPEVVRERVAGGSIAIPANVRHIALSPEGVGEGLRTKINVNLGVSGDRADEPEEWKKVDLAISYGAEAIMDLSNCGKTHPFRSKLVAKSPAMIGTVPMYDALGYLEKPLETITADGLSAGRAGPCRRRRRLRDDPCGHQPPHGRFVYGNRPQDEHRLPRRVAHLRLDADDRQREPLLRALR